MDAVQAREMTKEYRQQVVLCELNLSLGKGDCLVVTGPNGSGKTTLLRCLGGVTRPTRGSVTWPMFSQRHSRSIAQHFGYVAHDPQLYPRLTLRENLLFAARMYGVHEPRQRVDRQLSECGLTSHAQQLPEHVSRGIRQRLSIARALIHGPDLLLMDEPFTALDRSSCRWLEEVIAQGVENGQSICYTTHQPQAVPATYRVVELRAGRAQALTRTQSSGEAAA